MRFVILALAGFLLGCQSTPTHIDGRKVVGTKLVEGKRVYLVESSEGDRIITIEIAAESRQASKGMVFKSNK